MGKINEFLARFNLMRDRDDGHRLFEPAEHHAHERHHITSNRFMLALVAIMAFGLLLSFDRPSTYTDTATGYTLGYKTGMRQVFNENGLAMFVDGDEDAPRRLIAARSQQGEAGFYNNQSVEERDSFWEENATAAAEQNPFIDQAISLQEINLEAAYEKLTFLPDVNVSTEVAAEDGTVSTETSKTAVEGIRTKFTGYTEATGQRVDYAGENLFYVRNDGSVVILTVATTADRWETEREELLRIANAL